VFAPAAKVVADQGTEVISEGTAIINALKSKSEGLNWMLAHGTAGTSILPWPGAKKDAEELSEWYKDQDNKEFAAIMLEGAKDMNDLSDIIDFAYYNPTNLAAGTSGANLELTVGNWKATQLMRKLWDSDKKQYKTYGQLNKGDFEDYEWEAIEKIYSKKEKKNNLIPDFKLQEILDVWDKRFGEGGNWDINPDKSPTAYAQYMVGGKEEYQKFLLWLLSEDNNIFQEAKMMKKDSLGYYVEDKLDEKGNKIGGTITIRFIDTSNKAHNIQTELEDGVIKAFANIPLTK
jgi:hypothetical protein